MARSKPGVTRTVITRPFVDEIANLWNDAIFGCQLKLADKRYDHIPLPVSYRATGGLANWEALFKAVENGDDIRRLFADPTLPPMLADHLFKAAQEALMGKPFNLQMEFPAFEGGRALSPYWVSFWLRDGVLYEPTPALQTLLANSDIATELPLSYLRLPCPALCILPAHNEQDTCAGAKAIAVFEHNADHLQEQPSTERFLTFVAIFEESGHHPDGHRWARTEAERVTFSLENPEQNIGAALADAIPAEVGKGFVAQGIATERWKTILNHVAKLLLYLSLDEAEVGEDLTFTNAPRTFPGYGKRKREEKLAEVELLYDRYVVGPAVLPEELHGTGAPRSSVSHSVSPHWRRGHFRQQPCGPQQSLRRLIFIAPTLVRMDKLAG